MKDLPSGTVTFLFTDIEGSTKLWESVPERMRVALQHHHEILRCAIESQGGAVFQIIGDALCAAFSSAPSALSAAVQAQQNLFEMNWDLPTPIRVRMGIHSGLAEPLASDSTTGGYTSNQTLNRVARIMSSGHGGQILLSLAAEELSRDSLPQNSCLQDLGEHHLRDVIHPERLFQLNISGLPSEFPPLKTLRPPRHNLPVQLTDFIGREKELAKIDHALAQNRLVTIIGTGGSGKTRLAIEAGAVQAISGQSEHRFSNGVYFVTLAPLDSIDAIIPTIASALGFSFYAGGEPRQQLLDYLREKSLLLILDNFEHLLPGAGLVTEILSTAPGVKILVTSRIRLNLEGEQLFHLTGMEFPNWESPQDAGEYNAVHLFLQTARRVCPAFELAKENVGYVVRLCRLVDGMPLAILLAAAWMEMLSPEEIAGEIEKSLDFLETRQRDLPERQHSMRAVFDHSWKLLTPIEQNIFMKLSVFRGGFTRYAAQHVTGASLHDLIGLVEKSLIQRNPNSRYEIHELLRQYGVEKLANVRGELEAVRDRHSTYFANYLQRRESALSGKGQKEALTEIDGEIENIRTAWDWATLQGRVQDLHISLESLAEYLDMRSACREAALLMSTAAERLAYHKRHPDEITQLLFARIQLRQGYFLGSLGDINKGEALIRAALALFVKLGRSEYEAQALLFLGRFTSNWEEARLGYEKSFANFKKMENRKGEALSLIGLGDVTGMASEFEMSIRFCQEALEIFRELCDDRCIALTLDQLGFSYFLIGEYVTSNRYYQQSLAIHKEMGNRRGETGVLNTMAGSLAALGEFERSIASLQEALAINMDMGALNEISINHSSLAEILIFMGDYVNAAEHARQSLAWNQNRPEYLNWPNRTLGEALVGLGDLLNAREHLRISLEISRTYQEKMDELQAIKAISAYFAAQGNGVKALELIALINHHPASWQWTKDCVSHLAARLEAELPPDVIVQAKEIGRTRDLDTTVAELLEELNE